MWSWVVWLGVSVVGREHLLLVVLGELGGVGLGYRLGLHAVSDIVIDLIAVWWIHLLLIVQLVSASALVLVVAEVGTCLFLFILRPWLLLFKGFELIYIRLLRLTTSLSLKNILLGLIRRLAQKSGHLLRY